MNIKKFYLLLSPLIVLIIVMLFYASNEIFPFGSKTVAWCDLKQQTIPLLMNLKDVLDGKANLFYSTASGGGINFWGIFLFFLASPFNIIVKFIEKQDIIYLVNILLAIKLALCAFTSSLYFSISNKSLDKKYVIFLGLIYAFCGYGLMYYQTLIWLDIMYLFPLLVMSVDRLCCKKKSGFFIVMLTSNLIVNYYLSIMTVIYLIISISLYLIIRCHKENRKEISLKFIFAAISSALITAPVWLCSLLQIGKSARSMNNLSKLINNSIFASIKDKLCVIITTAFIFSALIYLIKSSLLKKSKVKYNLLLLLFLLIPVFIDPINKFWHGGGYQGFPLRFGYMIIFTILVIVSEIIKTMPRGHKSAVSYSIISFIIMIAVSFISIYVVINRKSYLSGYIDTLHVSIEMIEHLLALFLLAFLVYILYITLLRKKLISSNIFFCLICGIFITEVFVNLSVYVGYASNEDDVFSITANIEDKIDEEHYYRVKSEKKYVHVNMIGAIGFNSYAHYTSLTPEDYMFAMKKLGYSSYWMEVGSNGGTILTDALLGIKYSLGTSKEFKSYQKNLDINSRLGIAENLIVAPAGIISELEASTSESLELTNRFDIQKQIAKRFFGTDSMLQDYNYFSISDGSLEFSDEKYNITESEPDISNCRITYKFKVDGHKTLYFDLFDELGNNVKEPIYNSVNVSINGNMVLIDYPDSNSNGLLCLGEFNNQDVEIIVTCLQDISAKSFGVFGVDIDELNSYVKTLKTTQPISDGNKISVSCSANKNEYLYLAVPWDSGFSAYLNGDKTTLYKVNDSFCAVKLTEGENNVKLVFYPDGFKISVVLTVIGIATAIFICKKNNIYSNNKIGIASYLLILTGLGIIIIFIYIIPVIIYIAGFIIRHGV